MKRVLAFAGSNNPDSINHQLVTYASGLLNEAPTTLISLRDYPMTVFDLDVQQSQGPPENAYRLRKLIDDHDAYIISVSENNNTISAAFKNTIDWVSRAGEGYNILQEKPVLLMGTSPSPGGARNAITHATEILRAVGGKIVDTFFIPRYYQNVELGNTGYKIKDETLRGQLINLVQKFDHL